MNPAEIAKSRYATKKFDPEKVIPDEDFEQIKTLLRYSASSVNSQPWHFIIADSVEAKRRFTKATQPPYNANESKILDASHVILFCAKTDFSDDYIQKITDQEDSDGRFPQAEAKEMAMKVRTFYADLHRKTFTDTQCWTQKQVYLNIGTILLGAGALGIDAVPIEGVDLEALNEEFNLANKGLTAVAVVALGYRHPEDFNASLPKSRLPEEEVFSFI